MCVLREDGVMVALCSLVHQELTIHTMDHSLTKPVCHVHWVIIVRTAAQLTTDHLFVHKGITVPWEQNSPISSLVPQAHTIQMSTRLHDPWLVCLVLLVITVLLVQFNQLFVLRVTTVQLALVQGHSLLATLEHTMMSLG